MSLRLVKEVVEQGCSLRPNKHELFKQNNKVSNTHIINGNANLTI